ncbi:carbon-nitrogen hydrolase family protein [Paraburkholderia tagetis]|uniref:Carbon-nitrogen hydrolase family protein n=1 Tax=Paraburkholderia tagetis TaxID=2913261 RepID=A0A9X1UEH8_9BURK|nr:carbon-nitrogen hydrolase family protein [Paraburkholderia tagetis]
MSESRFVAAVVQAAPQYLDIEASTGKAVELIRSAAESGAQMIAFPELWLPGYPWWAWLGPQAWADSRGFASRYRREAFDYSGPNAQRLSEAARRYDMVVAMGVAERAGDTLYIGQWLIDQDGQTLWRRRKLKPGLVERGLFADGDGDNLNVADTPLGRVGGLCCGEHRQPLFKYALHRQHEDIHVAAWPSFSLDQPQAVGIGPQVNNALSQVYAVEGGCYVLAPCALVTDAMIELVCDTPERRARLQKGGGFARAFGPHGNALGVPLGECEEGLLLVTIERDEIPAAKMGYDVCGHSARLDVVDLDARSHTVKP